MSTNAEPTDAETMNAIRLLFAVARVSFNAACRLLRPGEKVAIPMRNVAVSVATMREGG